MLFHVFEVLAVNGYNEPGYDEHGNIIPEEKNATIKIVLKLTDIRSVSQIGFWEPVKANDPAVADNLVDPPPGGGIINGALGVFQPARPARQGRPVAQPPRPKAKKIWVVEPNMFQVHTNHSTWTVIGKFDEFSSILTQFQNEREIAE